MKTKYPPSRPACRTGREAARREPLIEINPKLEAIQQLIPIALTCVAEVLQEEVQQLAGARYARDGANREYKRWGRQRGSVYLGDQKVPLLVPRVRDAERQQEIPLANYHYLQQPRPLESQLFVRIIRGLSCRQYDRAARMVPQAFGLSRNQISRRFIRQSAKKLKELLERRLESYEFAALVLDGKTFGEAQMIIALGITTTGEKIVLGFVESGTENSRVCREFLQSLIARGLDDQQGLLVVIDGSKGLRKAVTEVFGQKVAVQRCQWHKRENVIAYLPKTQQETMRRKLQRAYEQPTYEQAKAEFVKLRHELKQLNQSAVASLDEGFEETLTLHRLGLFKELGISLKTTNCLESINAQIERLTHKVTHWRNSDQRQRWLASALLEIEPSLRHIKGYRHLPQLKTALQRDLKLVTQT
jgi:transposase-like protein